MCKTMVLAFRSMSIRVLYLLAIISIIVYSLIFDWIYVMIFKEPPSSVGVERATSGIEGFKTFFLAILIAPIFETLFKQYLIIIGLTKFRYFNSRLYIPIFISALCFALGHYYSIYYMFYAFGPGIILAIFFVELMQRKEMPFLNTIFLHSIINLLVFISQIDY